MPTGALYLTQDTPAPAVSAQVNVDTSALVQQGALYGLPEGWTDSSPCFMMAIGSGGDNDRIMSWSNVANAETQFIAPDSGAGIDVLTQCLSLHSIQTARDGFGYFQLPLNAYVFENVPAATEITVLHGLGAVPDIVDVHPLDIRSGDDWAVTEITDVHIKIRNWDAVNDVFVEGFALVLHSVQNVGDFVAGPIDMVLAGAAGVQQAHGLGVTPDLLFAFPFQAVQPTGCLVVPQAPDDTNIYLEGSGAGCAMTVRCYAWHLHSIQA